MTKYVVTKDANSDKKTYNGWNRDTAFRFFGKSNRGMYEMSLDPETGVLDIRSSIWLSGGQSGGDRMKIPRNVLMALLEDSTPVSSDE